MKAFIFFAFSITLSSHVKAENVYACDFSCQDIEAKAIVLSMGLEQDDIFSVVDFEGKYVRTYRADKYVDPSNGEMFDRTIRMNNSALGLQAVSHYRRIISSNIPRVTLPTNLPNTTQDDAITSSSQLILQPQLRDHIANWLKVNASLNQTLENIAGKIAEKIAGGSHIKVVVEITFADNSVADFLADFYSTNAQLETRYSFVIGSARFADGSRVPSSRNQVLGDWVFASDTDAAAFQRLGGLWRIIYKRSQACKPHTTFECRETSGGELECTTTLKCH